MKRFYIMFSISVLSVVFVASMFMLLPRRAQGQGIGGNQEQQAAQAALEANYPKLKITDQYLHLSIPGQTMGQTVGVAVNSKGHLFVYSRSQNQGVARGGRAAVLWEFDENYKFVKEWGPNNYAQSFAHTVRVDKSDNVWQVDEGSGMVVEFNPEGQSIFWLGRTPEAIDYLQSNLEALHFTAPPNQAAKVPHPTGRVGAFDRETDVTWDPQGNIFVSDGYGNSRIVKISPEGGWTKEMGTYGEGQDQFRTPHGITADNQGNIYVADRGNRRIQVYDSNLTFKTSITGVGAPWTVCVNTGTPQYLWTGDGTTGKIYKMDMTGKVLGMAVTGQDHGEQNTGDLIHSLDCRNANTVFIGSASMWDVQKVTIRP
jgi:DNA-binding beta-propeller fold protein YncE